MAGWIELKLINRILWDGEEPRAAGGCSNIEAASRGGKACISKDCGVTIKCGLLP
ncbi:MAG: hypothetical protein MUC60_05170 [Oscillatoria sp. Prado101]|nr:hypothetical protein [Oscillatoria sp. Prado101]